MEPLSYSFHVGVDKNKSKWGKQLAKNSKFESKSQTNNAIQNQAQLTKADKHNLRKYENNPEQIEVIVGTNNLVEDVKNTYLDLFENARIEFNSTQKRKDRMINNYFKFPLKVEVMNAIESGIIVPMMYPKGITANNRIPTSQHQSVVCCSDDSITVIARIINRVSLFHLNRSSTKSTTPESIYCYRCDTLRDSN